MIEALAGARWRAADATMPGAAAPAQSKAASTVARETDGVTTVELAAQTLRRTIKGDVLFDAASRGRYSTDASIYQIEPVGVVVPRDETDLALALDVARDAKAAILPRGAGTSQCGQTVGEALVVDFSQVHARRRRLRQGSRRGHGAARRRARPAQCLAEAARPLVSGRRLDLGAMHAGRHGRQQFLRQPLDPLRQHGAQRRRASTPSWPTARARASIPSGPRTCRRRCAPSPTRWRRWPSPSATRSSACTPRCCAGSAATTSTSSSRSRSGPTRPTIRSTWRICWSAAKARSRSPSA